LRKIREEGGHGFESEFVGLRKTDVEEFPGRHNQL